MTTNGRRMFEEVVASKAGLTVYNPELVAKPRETQTCHYIKFKYMEQNTVAHGIDANAEGL